METDKSQIARIIKTMQESDAHIFVREIFNSNLDLAIKIPPDSNEWLRLDRVVPSGKILSLMSCSDFRFGLDASGYVYITKDVAIAIKEDERYRLSNKLDDAKLCGYLLVAILVMAAITNW